MPSLISKRGDRHYLNHRDESGSESSKALTSIFGHDLTDEQVALFYIAETEGKRKGLTRKGRPPKAKPCPVCVGSPAPVLQGSGVPAIYPGLAPGTDPLAVPPGLRPCTPVEAAEVTEIALRKKVAQGAWRPGTLVQRLSGMKVLIHGDERAPGLGADSWAPYLGENGWGHWAVLTRYFGGSSLTSARATARKLIKEPRKVGLYVPDFVALGPEPEMTAALADTLAENAVAPRGDKKPHTLDDLRLLVQLVLAHDDIYYRLAFAIVAYQGMSQRDAHTLLSPDVPRGTGIDWQAGTYAYKRKKTTAKRRTIPLAPPLLDLLRPYRKGRGVSIPSDLPGQPWWKEEDKVGSVRTKVGSAWDRIEKRSGVTVIKGHRVKRLRHTFRILMRRKFKMPDTEIDHLMGWEYEDKKGDVKSHYEEADMPTMVEGIAGYAALITPQ